tara:strand:+ start:497 stop:946 length:450 start_codon:yes stop_codon:yes gene_type:complete
MTEENICAICLNSIIKDIFQTKCNHTFHIDCIKKWYTTKSTCPSCRKKNITEKKLIIKCQDAINSIPISTTSIIQNSLILDNSLYRYRYLNRYRNIDTNNNKLYTILEDINDEFNHYQFDNFQSNNFQLNTNSLSRIHTRNRYSEILYN